MSDKSLLLGIPNRTEHVNKLLSILARQRPNFLAKRHCSNKVAELREGEALNQVFGTRIESMSQSHFQTELVAVELSRVG